MKHIKKFNEDMDMESGLGFKLIGIEADEIEYQNWIFFW
jgi:hypothetical protein